ncbi:MAG: sel1 repeat family protein [Rheinheimera sp.]|nr:MAG: sel1 repeat family protein [Rheinheimera sp.]
MLLSGVLLSQPVWAQEALTELGVVQLYTQDELLEMIRSNTHLKRVQADDCQLVKDIEARADIMKLPAYQFLFGDMLAFGVCVPKNAERGWDLMLASALQGLPEGLEQVGRYYQQGKLVQKDLSKAQQFLYEAGAMGNINAQVRLAELFLANQGSPADYETVYRWLHHAITADKDLHARIEKALKGLASRMPEAVLTRAKKPL